MKSNSLTSAALLVLLALAVSVPSAAGADKKTVTAFARVNARTKEIAGRTYHLVAVQYDWRLNVLNSDATATVWLFNGKLENEVVRKVEPAEVPAGKLERGILLVWMKLPDEGNVEVHFGALRFEKAITDPAELRKRLNAAGYVPYTIEVNKAPVIQVDSAEGLTTKLKEITAQAGRKTTGPGPGAGAKEQ